MAIREPELKRDGVCVACTGLVTAGERAESDSVCGGSPASGVVSRLRRASCEPEAAITTDDEAEARGDGAVVTPGIPGASARREYERRRTKRIDRRANAVIGIAQTQSLLLRTSSARMDGRRVTLGPAVADERVRPFGSLLKRDDVCAACGEPVAAGERAMWDSSMKRITCLGCHPASARPASAAAAAASASHGVGGGAADDADVGRPGASAQREYERRRTKRIEETHARHPHVGELLLAVRSAPQHDVAFRSGAEGERDVAESLEARTASSPAIFLHDRRMPRGHGNIVHLAIAASGVYVIDAKNHKAGKVRIENPLFGNARLVIDGRDHTKLIDGLDRQVAAISAHLASAQIDVPVVGVLCFTKADLPLLGTMKMRSHLVLYRKALAKRINAPGPLDEPQIRELATMLAGALPPA